MNFCYLLSTKVFWFLGKLLEENIGLQIQIMCRPDPAGLYFIDVTLAVQDDSLVLQFFLSFPSLERIPCYHH